MSYSDEKIAAFAELEESIAKLRKAYKWANLELNIMSDFLSELLAFNKIREKYGIAKEATKDHSASQTTGLFGNPNRKRGTGIGYSMGQSGISSPSLGDWSD